MAISADAIIERDYFDEATKKNFTVQITVKDALLFDYLRKLENALRRK